MQHIKKSPTYYFPNSAPPATRMAADFAARAFQKVAAEKTAGAFFAAGGIFGGGARGAAGRSARGGPAGNFIKSPTTCMRRIRRRHAGRPTAGRLGGARREIRGGGGTAAPRNPCARGSLRGGRRTGRGWIPRMSRRRIPRDSFFKKGIF